MCLLTIYLSFFELSINGFFFLRGIYIFEITCNSAYNTFQVFTCPLSQFRGFNLYVINYSELFFLVSTVAFVICLLKILASFKSL